ncbi:MAG: minor capsid protein [Clostridia bacterium]|nr:minor capsid protein [Clostridia bacterium]
MAEKKKLSLEERIAKQIEKSGEYWDERFRQVEQARHEIAQDFNRRVADAVAEAAEQIEKDIARWYQRLAENNEVSIEEAHRLLKAGELKEFKWTVEEYIEAGRQSNVDGSWIKELENASAKFHITKLEAAKMEIRNSVEWLYTKELNATEEMAKQVYMDGYYRSIFEIQNGMGLAWDIAAIDRSALEKVLKMPWTADGRNFSDRIWTNKTKLVNDLSQLLTRNILLGRPPGDAIKDLVERTGRSEGEAARLLYTEAAYFGSMSQIEAFRALGVEKYKFVATLDERTSEICQSLDGTVHNVEDFEVGVNAPPMHPRCRSAISSVSKYFADVGRRAARDPETGKTILVPRSMTYKEWKEKYLKDKGEASSLMKKVKNTK